MIGQVFAVNSVAKLTSICLCLWNVAIIPWTSLGTCWLNKSIRLPVLAALTSAHRSSLCLALPCLALLLLPFLLPIVCDEVSETQNYQNKKLQDEDET